ncbi:MAG: HlyD family efflux transporter periplasmic adaptor subunit [Calditrichaeota bacterium]|nr:MAG: HlyD family efflux transporter periplasmic adaptor subunit [Calditrichota bacterium]
MSSYAKLRTDLVISEAVIDGEEVVNIKDPIRSNYFRLRPPEYWLISQLDGVTPYNRIAEKFRQKFKLNINEEAVQQFVDVLENEFFLENSRAEQVVSRKSFGNEKRESLFSKLLFIKLKAFKPGKTLELLTNMYRPFHSTIGYLLQILFIIGGLILFTVEASNFSVSLESIFSISSIITIIIASFVLLIIHEYAHAVACRLFGGQVSEMGFLFMYFQPCFYCDISDAWLFKKKSHRLGVTWAGLYSEFILFAFSIIIWRVTVQGTFVNTVAELILLIIIVSFIFNLNPLIKLDGYYLLSDILEIPNLRKKSFTYLSNVFKRIVLGWPIEKVDVNRRERRIYLIYAVMALIYTIFIVLYILIVFAGFLYQKFGYIGLFLLFSAIIFAVRTNISNAFKGFVQHIKYLKDIMKKPFRLVSYIVVIAFLIVLFFFIPFTHRVTGEVTIEPIAEFSLLLNDLGLLEKKFQQGGIDSELKSSYIQMASLELGSLELIPYVKDGNAVAAGDTLAILVSNQVTREIEAERSILHQLENDLALLQSPPKREEVDEAVSQVNAAQAAYDQAQRDQLRLNELFDKNLIPKEQYETALSKTEIAKAEFENRKAKLNLLKSPPKPEEEAVIRSQIEKQNARLNFLQTQKDAQSIVTSISGSVVINEDNDKFLSVIDNKQVEVKVPVSDFDIDLIQKNQPVKLKVRSYISKVFEGEVVHIPRDATIINDKAFFMVSVVLNNENDFLHKGMTGYAKIEIGDSSLFNLVMRRVSSIIRVEFWSFW